MKLFLSFAGIIACSFLPSDVLSQGTWSQIDSLAPLWTAPSMEAGVGFSINGKGYYALGDTSTCTYSQQLWEYDPALDTWSQKTNYPGSPRWGAVGFVINDIAYVGLGYDRITGTQNNFFAYHATTNTWTPISSLPYTGRAFASTFVIGNKGYMGMGGWYNGATGYCDTVFNDLWEYTPSTNTWFRKNDFPGDGRLNAFSWSIGSKGYWGTGATTVAGTSVSIDFWEYTPATDSWVQKPDYPYGSVMATVGWGIGNYGYVTCGMGSFTCVETWRFSPVTDTWTRMADFPGSDHYLSSGFVIGSKGYMIGGMYMTDAWSFEPPDVSAVEESSTTVSVNVFPNPFTDQAIFEIGNYGPGNYRLIIHDVKGSLISSISITSDRTIVPRGDMDSGMYSWTLLKNNTPSVSGRIIIE